MTRSAEDKRDRSSRETAETFLRECGAPPTHGAAETEDFNRWLIAWVWHNRKKTMQKPARN
jgi:hypothetical protein